MKLILSLFLTVSIIVFGPSGVARADTTIAQITTNSYDDSLPQIERNYLVWQGCGGLEGATSGSDDWEIFLYDIDNQVEIQLTDNDYNDILPQTDGEYVVWQGYNRTGGEIFLYHIGDPTPITNDDNAITNNPPNIDCSPQVANGLIAWTSHQVTDSVEPGEIMVYDTQSPSPTPTLLYADDGSVDPGNTLDDSAPRISDEVVMWTQTDEQGTTTKYLYDLPGGPAYKAPEGFIWEDSPQSDGILTVSTWYDGDDWEIIIHNKYLNGFEQITHNTLKDTYPRISGNYIAWMGGKGKMREIFLAELPSLLLVSITPDTIVVEGQEKVKVIVTDGEGKEVRGATVTLSGCGVDETDVTDKNGKVKFKNVNPSQIGTIQVTVSKDGHSDYIGSVTVSEAEFIVEANPEIIRLSRIKPRKGQEITVNVENSSSKKSVEDAQVTIFGCGVDETCVTDESGEAVFEGVVPRDTGTIQVVVSKDGYIDGTASIEVN